MARTKDRNKNFQQQRTVMKGATLPPPAETSEKGDRTTKMVFFGALGLTVSLVSLSLATLASQMKEFITSSPVNWLGIVVVIALTAVTVFLTRGLIWLSFFGSMMLASKVQGLKAQEDLCRKALKWRRMAPALGPWAAHVLVQNLISRGDFKQVITVGQEEYNTSSGKKQDAQALGPLCTAVAIAYQVEGNDREAITWNERAVESLTGVIAAMEKPGKDGKPPKPNQWIEGLRMQLAMAHFNAANGYFKISNYPQAKSHYQKASEQAYKAPESSEKQQIISVAKEQLARLKHS